MRELSKTEMAEVSGAGLLGGLANIAGSIVNSAVHSITGTIGVWVSGIGYAVGATVGLGMSFLDSIASIFTGGKTTTPKE